MNTLTKQIVYLPIKVENNKEDFTSATFYITEPSDDGEKITHFLKPQEGYFFTSEQLNEYTANVVRQALQTAAKTRRNGFYDSTKDEQSITNTFEETCKKFEV